MESYEFSLVFESVSERRVLMDLAPHLVNPLGFLFPVYAGARHNIWAINAGMLWQVSERLELLLGYRYIDMGEVDFGSFAGDGVEVSADYISHDITVGLGYRF